MKQAFLCELHERPQIFWPETTYAAETMSAWRRDVCVEALPTLMCSGTKNMDWRVCERFKVLQSTDDEGVLLVYNQHQPASEYRRFTEEQRNSFGAAVLRDAISFQ